MLGVALVINVEFQPIKLAVDKDLINERSYDFPVDFSLVEIGCFDRPIYHGMTGWINTCSLLDVVPVLNGQIFLKPEDFEADIRSGKIVLRVGKDVIAVLEGTHDIDARRTFGQPFKQNCQALAPFVSLGVVLNVLVFVDDGHCRHVTRFDAFE